MTDTAPDVATLEALLERVKQSTGPDREIDAGLFMSIDSGFPEKAFRLYGLPDAGLFGTGAYTSVKAPNFTGCVSSALALVEKALPATDSCPADSPTSSGWKIGLYRGTTPSCDKYAVWECMIRKHGGKEIWHHAPTAPLAILAALLQAKIAIVSGVFEESRKMAQATEEPRT